jgi:hypothetical protein
LGLKSKPQPITLKPETPTIKQPTQKPQQKPEPIDTSDWKTYHNEKYGFEVRYPKIYDEKQGCGLRLSDNGFSFGSRFF